jgi:peroxiredoxin
MTLKVGDKLPAVTLKTMTAEGPKDVTVDSVFKGKKVVLFALPGAFTPGCSMKHLPGYVKHYNAIKAKGVDVIACLSVNDAFVMGAWEKDQKAEGKVLLLADGNGEFTKAVGLSMDGSGYGMGLRSQRYAAIVVDGVVTHLNVEPAGGVDVSSAETILGLL